MEIRKDVEIEKDVDILVDTITSCIEGLYQLFIEKIDKKEELCKGCVLHFLRDYQYNIPEYSYEQLKKRGFFLVKYIHYCREFKCSIDKDLVRKMINFY